MLMPTLLDTTALTALALHYERGLMPTLIDTTFAALALLFSGDTELWQVVGVSFFVSGIALLLVLLPALLLGFALAYLPLPARWLWLSCINTLQSVPTVVIGLLLYMLLSRAGPFGDWKLLFTQQAMVIGQMLIAFPVIATMAHAAFIQSDRRAWETALTLGVSRPKALLGLMHECRFGLLAAVVGAFSRIVTEVGCSMMVGGNILHFTRNIPTAIALETQKGAFTQGVALGIVLLTLALLLNLLLTACRGQSYLKN